ncbi:MAG: hypothetical protein ACRESO_09725, partial [Gammaproteobacteria bacterium]
MKNTASRSGLPCGRMLVHRVSGEIQIELMQLGYESGQLRQTACVHQNIISGRQPPLPVCLR